MRLQNTIESFIDWTGRTVSWLTLFMVLVTAVIVLLRYGFDIGSIALQESVNYMHAMVFLIGAAYTLKYNEHVRVDIFYAEFSPRKKAWVDLLGSLFILLPVMVFIFWIGWEYVVESWQVKEGSREAGGLPGVFLIKSLILIMPVLLLLQTLAMALRSIGIIRNGDQS